MNTLAKLKNVAIVGATGAVGTAFLNLLENRQFPLGSLRLLASERSAGKQILFRGEPFTVETLTDDSFGDIDIAFFAAGGGRSRQFAPLAARAGAVVIDNSSAFRLDPEVPLVVPEVNPEDIFIHKGIIANPNCSTILMALALAPLHRLSPIKRVIVSTYQAVSGAGMSAIDELDMQTRAYLSGSEEHCTVFPQPIAFNLFSHNTPMQPNGYNEEEMKMVHETRKIFNLPTLAINATCIRVPVFTAHSESITVEFAGNRPTVEAARQALGAFPGVELLDDRENNRFPTPREASGKDNIFVGRIREDISDDKSLSLFLCGDQILKGAALNGFQIAELLIQREGMQIK